MQNSIEYFIERKKIKIHCTGKKKFFFFSLRLQDLQKISIFAWLGAGRLLMAVGRIVGKKVSNRLTEIRHPAVGSSC